MASRSLPALTSQRVTGTLLHHPPTLPPSKQVPLPPAHPLLWARFSHVCHLHYSMDDGLFVLALTKSPREAGWALTAGPGGPAAPVSPSLPGRPYKAEEKEL